MILFKIPEATPSNNTVMRMHHRARTAEHKRITEMVWCGVLAVKRDPVEQCVVTVTRYASRMLDWDNMGGGLKFLLDAMVKNKLIVDDNPNCIIKLNLEQAKVSRKEEKTVILIEEI